MVDGSGTQVRSTRRLWPRADRLLLVCALVSAVLAVARSVPLVTTPYEIDYGEGLLLEGALRVHQHQALYPNPYKFPIVLHDWGPVSYAAVSLVLPAGRPSFPAGRWMVLACAIALAGMLAVILRACAGSWRIGLAFGLLLLTLPAFRFWLYLLRTDVVGGLLLAFGIALYVRHDRWHWSIPFFGLAIFCKYTLIGAPVAVFLHLFLRRRRKEAIIFAAVLSASCGVAFAILQAVTGHWFAFHMFSTHSDRYSSGQFLALAGLVWASAPVITALAVWYVVRSLRRREIGFPTLYFLASTATSLSAGKLASTTNHFLEWMLAACLCAAIGYAVILDKYPAKAMPVTLLVCAAALVGVVVQNTSGAQPSAGLMGCGEAYQYVANLPSPRVLSESLGPSLLGGKPVLISDPFVYGQLAKHGLWPNREVDELVNQRYFALIVLSQDPAEMKLRGSDVWPQFLVEAFDRNYRVKARYACREAAVMLEPRMPGESPQNTPVTEK